MWLLDTNALIECHKLEKRPFKENNIYPTILSFIEFPVALKIERISVIYPSSIHYEQSLKNAILLREKGTPIPTIDILIGTVTVEKNLILVSEDSHFEYFQEVDPRLKIVSFETFLEKTQSTN